MRSEFQDVFKDAYDHWIDDACSHRYHASKSLALQVWQHQQSKVDELQKQLIDQGQRFNEQAQRVKDLEHKNGELQNDVSIMLASHKRISVELLQQQDKIEKFIKERDELQKRVDAVKKLIQDYKDEEKELELKEWEQSTIYGRVAIELEQALKGVVYGQKP